VVCLWILRSFFYILFIFGLISLSVIGWSQKYRTHAIPLYKDKSNRSLIIIIVGTNSRIGAENQSQSSLLAKNMCVDHGVQVHLRKILLLERYLHGKHAR